MPTNVYTHIPFCKSKCKYCSFISFPYLELIPRYINSLLEEIKNNYQKEKIKTLYFGGGTPSLIPSELIEKLFSEFNLDNNCEITFELNPDDADNKYLKELRNIGINRLSIGSQSFNDSILKLAGRRHNSKQIFDCIKNAKDIGFENISLDLIYGLPSQTLEILEKDLEKFINLDIQHISTYGLKIEENSYWGKNYNKDENKISYNGKKISLPNDDIQADMYELINKTLENKGFYRYEISNFAKQGYESKHNLNYWDNAEYYGFGVSAHGYIDGIRYSNYDSIEKYLNNSIKRDFEHKISLDEKIEEEIFLGFRKTAGINTLEFYKKYNINFEKKYQHILNKYAEYFTKTKVGYALNLQGTLVSNNILCEFLN